MGGWVGGGRVREREEGGQSHASDKFSAACGLRHAVTMKWTEFPGL